MARRTWAIVRLVDIGQEDELLESTGLTETSRTALEVPPGQRPSPVPQGIKLTAAFSMSR